MSSAWLSYIILTGAIIAACVFALDAVCKHAGWPRRWCWIGGMLLTVLFAFIAPENGVKEPNVPPVIVAYEQAIAQTPVENGDTPARSVAQRLAAFTASVSSELATRSGALLAAVERALPDGFSTLYTLAWLLTSSTLLLFIVIVHSRYARARKQWPATELHGVRVRLSSTTGPAVVGAMKPDIVVPKWLLGRSRNEQLMVLHHEGEHVRARDPLLLALAWSCAVLIPWHPAVWWMLARLRLAVELDCDARVLAKGAHLQQYGSLLIDLSQQTSGIPLGAAALADRTSQLERRLKAMNTNRQKFAALRGSGFGLLALALLVSACALRVPSRPPSPVSEPVEEQAAVQQPVRETVPPQIAELTGSSVAPIYFIDGVRVTKAMGDAMPASLIASIETRRPATAGGPSEIRILSVSAVQNAVASISASPPSPQPMIVLDGRVVQQGSRRDSASIPSSRPAQAPPRDTLPAPNWKYVGQMIIAPAPTTPSLTVNRAAGSDVVVQVRNPASASGMTQPMIIVDGVIQLGGGDPLADIPSDRIASIEVVRGAAATALYGQRAANGVINVTTKKN